MANELDRWATDRAPHLLERAEELAVTELARTLVEAALANRADRASALRAGSPASSPRMLRTSAEPVSPASTDDSASGTATEPVRAAEGEGLWTYCVVPAAAAIPREVSGVAPASLVGRVERDGLAALVSSIPLDEYGEAALPENLNDLAWLERVARAHEEVLEAALAKGPIVPLRLCTIYRGREGVQRMLEEQHASLQATLESLAGLQEWSVKLLVDRSLVETAATRRSDDIAHLEAELDAQTGGGAYMLQRRLARARQVETEQLLHELAEDAHARLQDQAAEATLNPPQNPDLAGYEGEMILNGAYLVETTKLPDLRALVDELGERHRSLGARLELTGPWPPYNFLHATGDAARA